MQQKLSKVIHIISVSGGKDSTVTADIAIKRVGRENCRFIFCETGNEHHAVYDYLEYLGDRFGVDIVRLKADFSARIMAKRKFIANDMRTRRGENGLKVRWTNKAKRRALAVLHPTGNPFIDLCLWKGRFPSRKAQFCTEELKKNMALAYQSEWLDRGYSVVSWQGVRRDESANRRDAKKIERLGRGIYAFRPLVEWSASKVFEYHKEHNINPNPLYLQGMTRVGCMPCLNVKKQELLEISKRFPGEVERIAWWEKIVGMASKRGFSTMISACDNRQDRRKIFADLNINSRVQWSKTRRGGRQFDLIAILPSRECASSYGLCE